jgi:hypothetical protein
MVWLATFPILPNLFRMRRRLFRRLITLFFGAGLGVMAGATVLPPLQGDLSGQIKVHALTEAPPLTWRVQVRPATDGALLLVETIEAPGFTLRAEAAQPADGSPGTWRVVAGELDLAVWRSAIVATGVTLPADFTVTGTVQLSGSGSLEKLLPSGTITANLSGGRAGSVEQGWDMAGLTLTATLALSADGITLEAARVHADTVTAAGVVARHVVIEAVGRPGGHIEVQRAELEVLGGRVSLAPFVVDPAALTVATTAEVTAVAMSELAALLPETLAAAKGRLSGRLELRWNAQEGFVPGKGSLSILPDEPASLRLTAAPGFLTQHMPERLQLLPEKLGALARWFAPKNPAYDSLRNIELGNDTLAVESLKVELYPDGPDGARSAVVDVSARPPAGSIVEQVSFTINVAGPLKQVIELGLDDRARINFTADKGK